jgi:rod shape-determining protein MreD
MTVRTLGRVLGVVAVTLVVQFTVGLDLTVAGAHPDLMLLLPIAAGVVGGPADGAIVGFISGMAADLLLPTPFGLSALVGCLVGFAVGYAAGSTTRDEWWLSALAALAASAAGVMLYAVLGAVLGEEQFFKVDLLAVVAVVSVANAVLAAPAVKLFGWVLAEAPVDGSRAPAAGVRR